MYNKERALIRIAGMAERVPSLASLGTAPVPAVPQPTESAVVEPGKDPVFLVMFSGQIESAEVNCAPFPFRLASNLPFNALFTLLYSFQNSMTCTAITVTPMARTGPLYQ